MKRKMGGYPVRGWLALAAIAVVTIWQIAWNDPPCSISRLPYDECKERRADIQDAVP